MDRARLWENISLPNWDMDRFFDLFLIVQSRSLFAQDIADEVLGPRPATNGEFNIADFNRREAVEAWLVERDHGRFAGDIKTAITSLSLLAHPRFDKKTGARLINALTGKYRSVEIHVDEFYRLMMFQISARVKTVGWKRSLDQRRIEHQEAASEVMKRFVEKMHRKKLKLKSPCPKVLIKYVQTFIVRELISVTRKNDRKTVIKAGQEAEDYERPDHRSNSVSFEMLANRLTEMEPEICRGVPVLIKSYRFMVESVLRGELIPTFDEMPRGSFDILSADDHADLSIALNKAVLAFAADHGA